MQTCYFIHAINAANRFVIKLVLFVLSLANDVCTHHHHVFVPWDGISNKPNREDDNFPQVLELFFKPPVPGPPSNSRKFGRRPAGFTARPRMSLLITASSLHRLYTAQCISQTLGTGIHNTQLNQRCAQVPQVQTKIVSMGG